MRTKIHKDKIRLFLLYLSQILAYSEIESVLSMELLGFKQISYPWSFIILAKEGFILPVLISALLLGLTILAIWLYQKAALYRWIAMLLGVGVIAIFIDIWLGLMIFKIWTGLPEVLYPWQLLDIWYDLPHYTWAYHQLTMSLEVASGIMGFILILYYFKKYHRDKKALGSAHFASALEIQRAGFFNKEGLIVGKAWGHWLQVGGFEHILVFAPSGSGKTRSIAIPNLLTFPDSVVVNDNKKTLWKTTSKYREVALGHQCYLWALSWSEGTQVRTFAYNPFDLIPESKLERIKEIQRLAHILIPDGKGDLVWYSGSRKLFRTILLYLLDTKDQKVSLGEINRIAKQADFDGWLSSILESTDQYDPEFYRNGYSYLNNHQKTRASIMETFTGYFELFEDPVIDAATQKSDFDIRKLRQEKMSIYVAFSDDDMERLSPLLTIFWQQVISVMIQTIPDPKEEPYPVLLLLDEFSSLGKIERLRRSLKLLREYRVRCILMIQYMAQTMERYTKEEAEAFMNIKTKVAFAPDSLEDAALISKLLGTKTQKVRGGSASDSQASGGSITASYHYQALPLKRPEEIMRLKNQRAFVISSGRPPIDARQCIWYQEPELKNLPYLTVPFVKIQALNQSSFMRRPTPHSHVKSSEEDDSQSQEVQALKTELAMLKNQEKELINENVIE